MWSYILTFVSVQAQEGNETAPHFITMNESSLHQISGVQMPVLPHVTYLWNTPLIISKGTGEFGFYVDEYDSNEVWVSGQWKGALHGPTDQVFDVVYAPTSDKVAFASLQYYMTNDSTLEVHIGESTFGLK